MATYTMEPSGIDYSAQTGMTAAEVDHQIEILRDWFPNAEFKVTVETAPKEST